MVEVTTDTSGGRWTMVRVIPEDSAHYVMVIEADTVNHHYTAIRIRWFCPTKQLLPGPRS